MSRGPNDAWVHCRCGSRHWGLAGAAGLLLISDDSPTVVLQHRALWSHHGGTWGIPGGALDLGEDAVEAALREASEEAGIDPDAVRLRATTVLAHPDWSYTTVLATAPSSLPVAVTDPESMAITRMAADDVAGLPLHPAFATAWGGLRTLAAARPRLVIDAANVVGSRPDGWWRDRPGAATRLLLALSAAAASGLPGSWFGLDGARLWPQTVVVLEGAARAAADPPVGARAAPLRIVRAPGSGDDAILDEVTSAERDGSHTPVATDGAVATGGAVGTGGADAPNGPVVVVTADRGLRERLPAATRHLGPGTLRDYLDT